MSDILKNIFYVLGFATLTAIGAAIKLPFFPYHPFTAQVIFVLMSGAVLGSFRGPLSQVVFLTLGLLGVPLFNELAPSFPVPALGASPGFMRTVLKAGWLEGFVAASYVTGITIEYARKKDFWTIFTAVTGGLLTLYILGLSFPVLIYRIPSGESFVGWAWPFLLMDFVKSMLVVFFLVNLYKIKKLMPTNLL
ncbi:MAG TPA: biotin transporter BioY [Actinobacteria bacterium]|nr:biotin transporter BioY [Actinomycetota bacterium]